MCDSGCLWGMLDPLKLLVPESNGRQMNGNTRACLLQKWREVRMEYYSDLLSVVFKSFSGLPKPKVLSLVPSNSFADDNVDDRRLGTIDLPSTFLPQESEIRHLAKTEEFVDDALANVHSSNANCIFMCPPFLGRMQRSPEFRSRFGSLCAPLSGP